MQGAGVATSNEQRAYVTQPLRMQRNQKTKPLSVQIGSEGVSQMVNQKCCSGAFVDLLLWVLTDVCLLTAK